MDSCVILILILIRLILRRRVFIVLLVYVLRKIMRISTIFFFSLTSSGKYLIWYILLFNLPIILIVVYLFVHNQNAVKPEPTHFERKPLSYSIDQSNYVVCLFAKVMICMLSMNIMMNWRVRIPLTFAMLACFMVMSHRPSVGETQRMLLVKRSHHLIPSLGKLGGPVSRVIFHLQQRRQKLYITRDLVISLHRVVL